MATTTSGASYYTCPNVGLKLFEQVYAEAEGKLDNVVKEYKLDVENDPIIITGGEDGNDHVKTGTIDRYRSVWRSLHKFCLLLGDYESALLLDDRKRPANPLPIKEETLRLYIPNSAFRLIVVLGYNGITDGSTY
jgi:hypothetical protein